MLMMQCFIDDQMMGVGVVMSWLTGWSNSDLTKVCILLCQKATSEGDDSGFRLSDGGEQATGRS